eukprot:TRINITY_DN36178_c0_g1_i2.p1 TRINITY_DN36178_c0_g1~~TRINITY_DN36178_c0_g1_i2.p1  ORF type:complete len:890 (+),score=151.57 TRINITY_DN36178_c0_g1_i2:131-2800(+)
MINKPAVRCLAASRHYVRGYTARSEKISCDVAVVGGGVMGCNVASALACRGASVVLLEQNSLTSGTTWHAAGLLGTLKASSTMSILSRYGAERYRDMNDATTGKSLVGWANTGSLAIARCQDSMEQLVRDVQRCHGLGQLYHRIVTPEEIKDIHPFLSLDGIVGGAYSPEDGICNPADVTLWTARHAREHGARFLERSECIGFELDQSQRRITRVRTDDGTEISCANVVLCGGAWMKKLSRLAFGENRLPVAMMPHQYTIFEKMQGVGNHLPVTRDVLNKYYLKPEAEPLEHLPSIVRSRNADEVEMAKDAEHELYEESIDKAGKWLAAAMEHVPVLGEVGVKQWLHGPDTHSSDHMPLVGRLPGTDNTYVAAGFNSQGIQLGPAVGVALAESILEGAAHSVGCDMSALCPSRVFPGLCNDTDWVQTRAGESYGKLYGVHFPLEGFEGARGRRLSPVHSRLIQLGAVFGETYGWERALYFPHQGEHRAPTKSLYVDSNFPHQPSHDAFSFKRSEAEYFAAEKRECLAARGSAALFDMSSFGKVKVSGPKALQLIQMCMSAEMEKPVGSVTYTLFCDARGGVLGDLTVTRLGEQDFYLVTLTNQPGKLVDQLHAVAATQGISKRDCSIEDVTESKAVLALNGPRSRDVLGRLTEAPLDNNAFRPASAQRISIAGVELLALRMSFAGELGWELHVPSERALDVYLALESAGKDHDMIPAGTLALLEALRTEKGFVHYGADVSQAETPLEAGLAFCCKLRSDQANFVGKEAIVARRKQGWTKRLVSVQLQPDAGVCIWGHEEELIYRNGERVGSLTSGCFSHTLGCAIGMGYIHGPPKVPKDWLLDGSYEVEVPVRVNGAVKLQKVPAAISLKCLVDADGRRIQGQYDAELI